MLKEVMLGSGGIMLAAAIFTSSLTPGASPAPVAPEAPAPQIATPPPAVQVASPRPAQIFPDETDNLDFGAPMIETAPIDAGADAPAPVSADPYGAEASGGRQFNPKPGEAYPIPR